MNTTKTLALVAMTALSLGMGSAMAQNSAPSQGNYAAPAATARQASAPTVTRTQDTTVQYGSSDHYSSGVPGFNTDPIGGGF
jgi:hypothetical protein